MLSSTERDTITVRHGFTKKAGGRRAAGDGRRAAGGRRASADFQKFASSVRPRVSQFRVISFQVHRVAISSNFLHHHKTRGRQLVFYARRRTRRVRRAHSAAIWTPLHHIFFCRVLPLSLFYSDASADGVEERQARHKPSAKPIVPLYPASRLYARLKRNVTMSHTFSCVQPPFIDL